MRFRVVPLSIEKLNKEQFIEANDYHQALALYKEQNKNENIVLVAPENTVRVYTTLIGSRVTEAIKERLQSVINLEIEVLPTKEGYLIKMYDELPFNKETVFAHHYKMYKYATSANISEDVAMDCIRDYLNYNCRLSKEVLDQIT